MGDATIWRSAWRRCQRYACSSLLGWRDVPEQLGHRAIGDALLAQNAGGARAKALGEAGGG